MPRRKLVSEPGVSGFATEAPASRSAGAFVFSAGRVNVTVRVTMPCLLVLCAALVAALHVVVCGGLRSLALERSELSRRRSRVQVSSCPPSLQPVHIQGPERFQQRRVSCPCFLRSCTLLLSRSLLFHSEHGSEPRSGARAEVLTSCRLSAKE